LARTTISLDIASRTAQEYILSLVAVQLGRVYIGEVEHDITSNIAPSFLALANSNDPISAALPKVSKASSDVPLLLALLPL